MSIILVLIFGLVLRLINLNQSLWLDETVQALTSKGSFLNVFNELQGDFHPPLYHLLMWGWVHIFGNGEIVMRIPSVLFGVATIWVVYQIGKLIKPKSSLPLLAALLMAIAPFHVYYSQEARTYAFTAFTTVLSFYYFLRLILNKNPNKLGYVLATV
ncbi:MAG: glycosyltransferase family 39 protein, partial [Candidatus Shapirobacteria bacterium]|nr:glycosyltransferase family 39 protein [Candidatus Shapirobacteria bacterium]